MRNDAPSVASDAPGANTSSVHARRVAQFEQKGGMHPELARLNRAFFREIERHEDSVNGLNLEVAGPESLDDAGPAVSDGSGMLESSKRDSNEAGTECAPPADADPATRTSAGGADASSTKTSGADARSGFAPGRATCRSQSHSGDDSSSQSLDDSAFIEANGLGHTSLIFLKAAMQLLESGYDLSGAAPAGWSLAGNGNGSNSHRRLSGGGGTAGAGSSGMSPPGGGGGGRVLKSGYLKKATNHSVSLSHLWKHKYVEVRSLSCATRHAPRVMRHASCTPRAKSSGGDAEMMRAEMMRW